MVFDRVSFAPLNYGHTISVDHKITRTKVGTNMSGTALAAFIKCQKANGNTQPGGFFFAFKYGDGSYYNQPYFPVDPKAFLGPISNVIGFNCERWRFKRLTFRYVPYVPTTQAGSMVLKYLPDVTEINRIPFAVGTTANPVNWAGLVTASSGFLMRMGRAVTSTLWQEVVLPAVGVAINKLRGVSHKAVEDASTQMTKWYTNSKPQVNATTPANFQEHLRNIINRFEVAHGNLLIQNYIDELISTNSLIPPSSEISNGTILDYDSSNPAFQEAIRRHIEVEIGSGTVGGTPVTGAPTWNPANNLDTQGLLVIAGDYPFVAGDDPGVIKTLGQLYLDFEIESIDNDGVPAFAAAPVSAYSNSQLDSEITTQFGYDTMPNAIQSRTFYLRQWANQVSLEDIYNAAGLVLPTATSMSHSLIHSKLDIALEPHRRARIHLDRITADNKAENNNKNITTKPNPNRTRSKSKGVTDDSDDYDV